MLHNNNLHHGSIVMVVVDKQSTLEFDKILEEMVETSSWEVSVISCGYLLVNFNM